MKHSLVTSTSTKHLVPRCVQTGPGQHFNSSALTSSRQFGDGNAAFDPQRVDVSERHHSMVKVEQLLSVHQHPKTTVFTVNLHLRDETRRLVDLISHV